VSTFLRIAGLAVLTAATALVVIPAIGAAASGQTTMPFTQVMTNPCNGDVVTITGEMHMVSVMSDRKAEIQTNWPDTRGVAMTTGTLYQANDANHLFIVSVPSGRFTIGLQDSYELVSQDASPNFLVHELMEITFDPSSGFSVKMRGEPECSG
jgi:hypothetical protein